MHVEDTLDPSLLTTRKVDSMSDLVAEMVLGACSEDENAAADAAALAVARRVAVESMRVSVPAPIDVTAIAPRPSRRVWTVFVATALGLVALAVTAGVTFFAFR